jgi:hypothetical protein
MPGDTPQQKELHHAAVQGTVLGYEGEELREGVWERGVYLAKDGFVYHIIAQRKRGVIKTTVVAKRPIGEYLRWVDEMFSPGEIPSETNGVHYRAARLLRELI